MERKQKKSRKARMPREEESKCSKQDDEREEQDRLQRRNKLLADAVDHFDRLGVSDKLVEFRRYHAARCATHERTMMSLLRVREQAICAAA